MKNFLDRISKNAYLVFFLTFFKLWEIVRPLFTSVNTGDLKRYYADYDWLGFSIHIVTVTILFLILRAYLDLKRDLNITTTKFRDRMRVFSMVSHFRGKRLFVKHFDDTQYFRLPNESDAEVWERLPEGGLFRDHLMEEYQLVRAKMIESMKNKSITEIESLLKEFYPRDFRPN